MRRSRLVTLVTVLAASSICAACVANSPFPAESPPNLILLIGDGMDDQQLTIARNYLVGSNGTLLSDSLPFRGTVQVQAIREDNPHMPNYVADSASTATAMATGVVTSRSRIGTAAGSDDDLRNIMEVAQEAGIRTGIVTTASVTDATPASFVGHINMRWCQGPEQMQMQDRIFPSRFIDCSADLLVNGGKGSLAEQIARSGLDVIMGGGARYFASAAESNDGKTVVDVAEDNGFDVVTRREQLESVSADGRVLGLFSAGTMPVRWRGEGAQKAEFLERRDGELIWPEAFACEENPDFANMPKLSMMVENALQRLHNERGFILVVESASIDKESHSRNPCGQIGEVGQLQEALSVALEYQKRHENTLLMLTGDHGHTAQIIPDISAFAELQFSTRGRLARVRTPEGGVMGINYASNDSPFWDEHSGVQIPLYASGPGAADIPLFIRQVEIHSIASRHMGLARTGVDEEL